MDFKDFFKYKHYQSLLMLLGIQNRGQDREKDGNNMEAGREKIIKKVKEPKTSWVVPRLLSQCSILQEKQRPSWNAPKATVSFYGFHLALVL